MLTTIVHAEAYHASTALCSAIFASTAASFVWMPAGEGATVTMKLVDFQTSSLVVRGKIKYRLKCGVQNGFLLARSWALLLIFYVSNKL